MAGAKTNRVVFVHGPGDVRLGSAEAPLPGDGDVLMRMQACGICGTDVHYIKSGGTGGTGDGEAGPMPIGHEGAGEIIGIGADIRNLQLGARMIVNPMATSAVIGNGGPEGAFSDLLLVRDAADTGALLPIPEGLSCSDAALAEPLAVSLRAVNRAEPRAGETAVVFGAGPIGLGIILWLKRKGASDVIAVDFSARRLELAREIGADFTIDASKGGDVDAAILQRHGSQMRFGAPVGTTDMYFDAAGAPPVVASAIALGKAGSRLVIVAMHGKPFPVDVMRFMGKEMTMTGSVGYQGELAEALEALPEIGDLARRMVTDVFSFDDVLAGLARAAESDSGKVMIDFTYGEGDA